ILFDMLQHVHTDSEIKGRRIIQGQQIFLLKRNTSPFPVPPEIVPAVIQVIRFHVNSADLHVGKLPEDKPIVLPESRPGVKQFPGTLIVECGGMFFKDAPYIPAAQEKQIQQPIKEGSQSSAVSDDSSKSVLYRIVRDAAHLTGLGVKLLATLIIYYLFTDAIEKPNFHEQSTSTFAFCKSTGPRRSGSFAAILNHLINIGFMLLCVSFLDKLPQEPDRKNLGAQHHQHHSKKQQGTIPERGSVK